MAGLASDKGFNEKLDKARKARARLGAIGTRSRRDAWDKRADVASARAEDNRASKANGAKPGTAVAAPMAPKPTSKPSGPPAKATPAKKPRPKSANPPKPTINGSSTNLKAGETGVKSNAGAILAQMKARTKKAPTHEHYQGVNPGTGAAARMKKMNRNK